MEWISNSKDVLKTHEWDFQSQKAKRVVFAFLHVSSTCVLETCAAYSYAAGTINWGLLATFCRVFRDGNPFAPC